MKRPNTILKNKSDCHINEINSNLLCCKSYNFYQCFFFFGGLKHIDNVWLIPLLFYFGTPVIVGCSKILGNSLTPLFCMHKILDLNDFFLVLVLEWTVLGGFLSLLGSGKRWEVENAAAQLHKSLIHPKANLLFHHMDCYGSAHTTINNLQPTSTSHTHKLKRHPPTHTHILAQSKGTRTHRFDL